MVPPKYDINKSIKLSNKNICNIVKIQEKKGFSNESEVVRFCLNFVAIILEKDLETTTLARLLEEMANSN